MPRKVEWCWGRGSTPRGLLAVLGALGALGAVTVPAEKVLAADNACAQLQLTAGTLSEQSRRAQLHRRLRPGRRALQLRPGLRDGGAPL